MEDDGPYVKVYGQVNPLTGERLGRAPRTADGMRSAILAGLEAAEPHATRERHWQLARQAAHQGALFGALHRRDGELVEEHLAVPRLDQGERAAGPGGGRLGAGGVLGRAGPLTGGDPAGGQPGRAAACRGAGGGDPHGLPRPESRRAGNRQVGEGWHRGDVLAAGHQP